MRQTGRKTFRCVAGFLILFGGALFLLLCNIGIGSVSVSVKKVVACLSGGAVDSTVRGIVWNIRLPRALSALILGGALALSGYLLQTFFHNPIAGPFVLGISSGSKLIVSLVMVFLFGNAVKTSSAALIGAALADEILRKHILL